MGPLESLKDGGRVPRASLQMRGVPGDSQPCLGWETQVSIHAVTNRLHDLLPHKDRTAIKYLPMPGCRSLPLHSNLQKAATPIFKWLS